MQVVDGVLSVTPEPALMVAWSQLTMTEPLLAVMVSVWAALSQAAPSSHRERRSVTDPRTVHLIGQRPGPAVGTQGSQDHGHESLTVGGAVCRAFHGLAV